MNKIDYKIFVPRGENNYVRFNTESEFLIESIATINIHLLDDKVIYWLYVDIPHDDEHHKLLVRKGKKPKLTLLIGNNPFEIIGESEVIDTHHNKMKEVIEVTLSLIVKNASETTKNPREVIKHDRSDLLDIRDD